MDFLVPLEIFCPIKVFRETVLRFCRNKEARLGKKMPRVRAFEMTNERREQYHWSGLHLQLQFTVYIGIFATDRRNCSGLPSVQTPDVLIFWATINFGPNLECHASKHFCIIISSCWIWIWIGISEFIKLNLKYSDTGQINSHFTIKPIYILIF